MAHPPERPALPRAPTITAPVAVPRTPAGTWASDVPRPVTIAREDLRATATLVTARLDGARTVHRIAALDDVRRAARRLSRALDDLARRSIMEYRGSHGTWDVRADAGAVFLTVWDHASALDRAGAVDVSFDRWAETDR